MKSALKYNRKRILAVCFCISMAASVSAMGMPRLADIVSGLPQNFLVTEANVEPDDELKKQPENQDILKTIRYEYVSEDPVRQTDSGEIFLKADLRYTQYKDKQKALAAMQEIQSLAHPDMGLSYEWDYLILSTDSIYHLHASCVFSEDLFNKMASNLDERIAASGNEYASTIHCRCGGGCRQPDLDHRERL